MSTTPPQHATTPIPVQLSEPEFTAFILPHLSMPKRGPKCKLGYHQVFNLILWVLYTGMQWKCLPVPTGPHGKPAIHYTTIYKVFAKWADDGRRCQDTAHSTMDGMLICVYPAVWSTRPLRHGGAAMAG